MDPFFAFLLYISILIVSVVAHEVSHGAVANMLGDPTAKLMGRLTLNPVPHIDPFGSIILPLILLLPAFFGYPIPFLLGWAKPVPFNPYNLSNQKWGPALVGAAGPAANFTIALLFGLAIRFAPPMQDSIFLPVAIVFGIIVYLNILLGLFNLLPIPPLDGSKVFFALPMVSPQSRAFLEQYGLLLLIFFIMFGFPMLKPIIRGIFMMLTGFSPDFI